jgi:hypothetical protein
MLGTSARAPPSARLFTRCRSAAPGPVSGPVGAPGRVLGDGRHRSEADDRGQLGEQVPQHRGARRHRPDPGQRDRGLGPADLVAGAAALRAGRRPPDRHGRVLRHERSGVVPDERRRGRRRGGQHRDPRHERAAAGGIIGDWSDLLGTLEADGYDANTASASARCAALFRQARSTQGERLEEISITPDYVEIDGTQIQFPMRGLWPAAAANSAEAIAFDRSEFVLGVRQDITWKLLDQAVIQDNTGAIVYNLAQQDMVAMRMTMRVGWQVANTINYDQPSRRAATRRPSCATRSALAAGRRRSMYGAAPLRSLSHAKERDPIVATAKKDDAGQADVQKQRQGSRSRASSARRSTRCRTRRTRSSRAPTRRPSTSWACAARRSTRTRRLNRWPSCSTRGRRAPGSTVIASYQSNVAGGSLTAFDEKALTLSGTAANLVVAAGDVLASTRRWPARAWPTRATASRSTSRARRRK